jgi:hypothetical protein
MDVDRLAADWQLAFAAAQGALDCSGRAYESGELQARRGLLAEERRLTDGLLESLRRQAGFRLLGVYAEDTRSRRDTVAVVKPGRQERRIELRVVSRPRKHILGDPRRPGEVVVPGRSTLP